MTMQMKIAEEREDAEIIGYMKALLELDFSSKQIINKLCQKFDLTEEEAKKKLHEYEENC